MKQLLCGHLQNILGGACKINSVCGREKMVPVRWWIGSLAWLGGSFHSGYRWVHNGTKTLRRHLNTCNVCQSYLSKAGREDCMWKGSKAASLTGVCFVPRTITWRPWPGSTSRWPGPTKWTPTSTSRCLFTKWMVCQMITKLKPREIFTRGQMMTLQMLD